MNHTNPLLMIAALLTLFCGPNAHADDHTAGQKRVKVYVLSGQSNMVGIGQVNPAGSTRYNTYVSEETTKENQGCILSIYKGEYDSKTDYDKLEPVETHMVPVGYWPHAGFPKITGEQTHVARGHIKIDRPGRYNFRSSAGSICEVAGKVFYNSMPNQESVKEVIKLDKGIYPIKITFAGRGQTNLSFQFYDVPGSLHTLVKEQGKYSHLLNDDGEWASRDDVWYKGVVTAGANKWLSAGCGASANNIGPELGFGWVLGDHHDEPVLILKASQGNRSLGWDYLPPGSKRFEHADAQGKTWVYAGYKDSPSRWERGTTPEPINWYAGKQYDDCFNAAKKVLANFDENFPQWKGRGYEIAGFAWWQGHKDQGEPHASRYEQNLAHMIKTLRKEFDAPKAPFVVATIGFGGWELAGPGLTVADAQLAVGDSKKHPEFAGNVKSVETRDFWRKAEESPRSQGFHYNQNAETYYRVGDAMGKAMVELINK